MLFRSIRDVNVLLEEAGPEASATLSPFTEGEPPDGRAHVPGKDVNPKSKMTTRGYEHQRGLQAQEGQTKAARPTNWAYTLVTIWGRGNRPEGDGKLITIYRGAAA